MMKLQFLLTFALLFFVTSNSFGADGFGGAVTGGAGGSTVTVNNYTSFRYYATSIHPYIIRVSGAITLDSKVQPKPNKTIEGVSFDSTLIGNLDLSDSQSCDNIIIRNLNITNPAGDGVTVWGATNVFITHCNIYDCGDGAIDMNNGADYIHRVLVPFQLSFHGRPSVCSYCRLGTYYVSS